MNNNTLNDTTNNMNTNNNTKITDGGWRYYDDAEGDEYYANEGEAD